jgi:cytochrome c-type biogenesis protein CcmH
MIASMVEQLADRLKDNPNDIAGWTQLARSYVVLKQTDNAKDALAQALKIAPDNVDILVLYGRTVRAINEDRQTPESIETMRKILAIAPTHVEALWERAIAQFSSGAPERAQLRQRIDQLN